MSTSRLESLTRKPDRGSDDRAELERLLDDECTGVLSTVLDGEPWAVPMLYVRDGERILLHGSTGAGALRHVAAGAPVVFTIFRMESLVVARTALDHSADYRSATLRGTLEPLAGDDEARALDLLTDGLLPGRMAEIPPNSAKDLAATQALVLPIGDDNWLLKQRTHGFTEADGERADDDPTWAGTVPLRRAFGPAVPAPGNREGVAVPASVRALTGDAPA